MGPRWKLTVEGLGKIEHAEVEVRPLMLFVGENNSGKSYLTSLLWGLFALQGELTPPEGPALEACKSWIAERISEGKGPVEHELTTEEMNLFRDLFETAVEAGGNELVARVFNTKSVCVKRLSFRNISPDQAARIQWSPGPSGGANVSSVSVDAAGAVDLRLGSDARNAQINVRDALMRYLAFGRLAGSRRGPDNRFMPGDPIFLPASRTGFMQLYKAAARRSMEIAYRRETAEADLLSLTNPSFHFLDMLAFGLRKEDVGDYASEGDFLEQALQGKVDFVPGVGVNDYQYHPAGAKAPLTMNLSSSLVTEVAPIILVLRHIRRIPVLILEEPEAHLHPKLQRKLAQVVVRLIRKGLYVWITTHSENFCQQLNNFMKLGALDPSRRAKARQKLGYGEQDYLELDDVTGYQFKLDELGERSIVTELKRSERGMAMPTFNKELLRLGEEIDFLDQLAEE